jgi:hypothetical protein
MYRQRQKCNKGKRASGNYGERNSDIKLDSEAADLSDIGEISRTKLNRSRGESGISGSRSDRELTSGHSNEGSRLKIGSGNTMRNPKS